MEGKLKELVSAQLEELRNEGEIGPHVKLDSRGRVITLRAEKLREQLNDTIEVLRFNTKLIHQVYHEGGIEECGKSTCRSVVHLFTRYGVKM